jgi:ribosome-binding protein aMBF1 (putative translation factor)
MQMHCILSAQCIDIRQITDMTAVNTRERVGNDLANKIIELRRSRGWTQQQLADKLRTRQSTVSRWERGIVQPVGLYLTQLTRLLLGKRVR